MNSKVRIRQAAEGGNQETVRLVGAFCGEHSKVTLDGKPLTCGRANVLLGCIRDILNY